MVCMCSPLQPVLYRGREGFSRLQAAKDFFEAFANRSQAYDFHHSMGLTTFHSSISVKQPLSRIYEFFRVSDQCSNSTVCISHTTVVRVYMDGPDGQASIVCKEINSHSLYHSRPPLDF